MRIEEDNSEWLKYWYICTSCDASIEIVSKSQPKVEPTCNCGATNIILCQTSTHAQE